jgi:hypothetical protein
MNEVKEDLALSTFGRSREIALAGGQCVKCGAFDLMFRDEISQREYLLTVWCQDCQNNFFDA